MRQTFRKTEKLCSKSLIKKLFAEGKSFSIYPFRVIWLEVSPDSSTWQAPVQLAISVPRRKIRKAVDRNKIKRRIREAYRKHKCILYPTLKDNGKQIAMIFIYLHHEGMEYRSIKNKIIVILQRFVSEV